SNHAPLVVAEQFTLLEALHRGRVDLGLGRAPGADPLTAAALHRSVAGLGEEEFPQQVDQVLALLGLPRSAEPALRSSAPVLAATPVAATAPEVWLLGSSGYSAQLAGLLRLPFCFAGHNGAPREVAAAVLALYREAFAAAPASQEGGNAAGPRALVTASVVAAPTAHDAERLARPGRLQRWAERTGGPITPFASPEDAARVDLGVANELAMAAMPFGVVGAPQQVAAELQDLAAVTGADELVLCSFVHGGAARVQTLELLAAAWGLGAPPRTSHRAPLATAGAPTPVGSR
ncbi:MAG: hypothetical protein AVDCRST_MAG66-2621, partial [uncultured Pseudonocardia sp.]